MRNAVLMVAVAATLGGCASGRGVFGGSGPDEFSAARAAPLVVPPDFALTPPAPGQPRAQNGPSQQALEALFGGPAARSAAEAGALQAAGNDRASPGIRSSVGDPGTNVVDKGSVTRDIIAAPEGDGAEARATTPQ